MQKSASLGRGFGLVSKKSRFGGRLIHRAAILHEESLRIIFWLSLCDNSLSFRDMSFVPASHHRRFLLICEVLMVWHDYSLIMRIASQADEVLGFSENDVNESITVCDLALWHLCEDPLHHFLGRARVMLLCMINVEPFISKSLHSPWYIQLSCFEASTLSKEVHDYWSGTDDRHLRPCLVCDRRRLSTRTVFLALAVDQA